MPPSPLDVAPPPSRAHTVERNRREPARTSQNKYEGRTLKGRAQKRAARRRAGRRKGQGAGKGASLVLGLDRG